jgi:hypothetical protein
MLFALPALAREGFSVDAHGCRQFGEALQLLRRLAAGRVLPHLTVIALGADGAITRRDIQSTVAILGPRRTLVLVTPLELGGSAGSDAATVRDEARRHPDRIHLLDWVRYSAGHAGWFQPDHLHLTFAGADAFARLLRQALPLAAPPPAPSPPAPAPTLTLTPIRAGFGDPDQVVLGPTT